VLRKLDAEASNATGSGRDEHIISRRNLGEIDKCLPHSKENGRICLMFCTFEGRPRIIQIYGRAHIIERTDPEFETAAKPFREFMGARSIVRVDATRISESCGFGVPEYTFQSHRDWSLVRRTKSLACRHKFRDWALENERAERRLLFLREAHSADAEVQTRADFTDLVERGVLERSREAAPFEVVEVSVLEVECVLRVPGQLGGPDACSHPLDSPHSSRCHDAVVSVPLVRVGRLERLAKPAAFPVQEKRSEPVGTRTALVEQRCGKLAVHFFEGRRLELTVESNYLISRHHAEIECGDSL